MPADASIYGLIKPAQQVNPLEQYAQIAQLRSAQNQDAAAQYTLRKVQREDDEATKMNALYAAAVGVDGKLDPAKLVTSFAQGGLGSKLPAIQKQLADQRQAEVKAETDQYKLATDRYNTYRTAIGALAQDPNLTRESAIAAGQSLVDQGIIPAALHERAVATMSTDPVQLRAVLQNGLKAQMSPDKIFEVFAPKAEKIDTGAQLFFKDTNPNSPTFGQQIAGAPVAKEQSPDNKATVGASLANAAATRDVAQATRDAANVTAEAKRVQDTEMKLSDDYRTQSKNFKEVADAHRTIITALDKATTSPAATLAGATKFMKLLDPGSVVRESELGMALAASGIFDRAANYINVLRSGKVLTATQAADFKNVANAIYGAAQKQQQQIDADYTGKAKAYGLRPEMIVQDFGQNRPGGGQPGTPAAPAGVNPAAIAAELARRGVK